LVAAAHQVLRGKVIAKVQRKVRLIV
jgi:hypothetical protein